jgi:multiple sugar transport system permease protein
VRPGSTLGTFLRRHAGTVGLHILLIAGGLIMAYPFMFGLLASFCTIPDYGQAVFLPIPSHFTLVNVKHMLENQDLWLWLRNSTIRCVWFAIVPTLLSLTSGYAFARVRFPGRGICFMLLLASLMVPGTVTLAPIFVMISRWPLLGGNDILGAGGTGMYDSWWALLSLGLVNAFSIFFIRQTIQSVPIDYDESARLDGAGILRVIFGIYAPMMKPVIITVAVLSTATPSIIAVWNDYLTPLIFTAGASNVDLTPIATGVTAYASSLQTAQAVPNYPLLFAAAMLGMLPTVVIFFLFQKYLVQGFAAVGIKG